MTALRVNACCLPITKGGSWRVSVTTLASLDIRPAMVVFMYSNGQFLVVVVMDHILFEANGMLVPVISQPLLALKMYSPSGVTRPMI